MISKQKARRAAYKLVVDAIDGHGVLLPDVDLWDMTERELITAEVVEILAELKKKSQ